MEKAVSKPWVYGLAAAFIALNTILLANEFYWLAALPLVLAIIGMAFLALDKLLYLVVFLTPLSISIEELDLGVSMSVPTEPLFVGLMIMFFLKLIIEGGFDKDFMLHPLTIIIGIQLVWMLMSTITSEIPLVSLKYMLVRMWSVTALYFVMSRLFTSEVNVKRFLWMYLVPLSAVILYTTYVHWTRGFSKASSINAMYPLVKEHTSYGAIIALYVPSAFALAFLVKAKLDRKAFALTIFLIILTGLVLSYTRAAWVSVVASIGVLFLLLLRIRAWQFWSLSGVAVIVLLFNLSTIMQQLQSNNQDSSDDLGEHVESISNISTDASNLERINRWNSALRMFKERPITGYGPGTYQFVYAPFQNPREKTIISTNNGDVGNAHSEYIGPLAEQGLPGLVFILAMIFIMAKTAVRVVYNSPSKTEKLFASVLFMGLITYFTHGFLNNFLDMDKAAVPVWGFCAALVMMDLKRVRWKDQESIKD
jgi:O-antigen ligase